MMKKQDLLVFNSLKQQYDYLGLPASVIDESIQFTIHNLREIHEKGPYKSPVYRANFFSFVFVKDATGHYTTDDLAFDTEPGTIYFTNPGHYKSFHWKTINEVCLVTMSEAFLKQNVHADIFNEFPFLLAETVPPRVLPPDQFAEFELLYTQIAAAYSSTAAYRNKIIGNLFVVILLKIKEYFWLDYNPIYEGNRGSQIVKDFKTTLEKHYRDLSTGKVDKIFRLADYASMQSLHPNYLNNVIKNKTGKAVGTWISEKLITEAKSMLQHPGTAIKEISYRLGFSEATHFSNYFKKHTGVSPVAFRRTL